MRLFCDTVELEGEGITERISTSLLRFKLLQILLIPKPYLR